MPFVNDVDGGALEAITDAVARVNELKGRLDSPVSASQPQWDEAGLSDPSSDEESDEGGLFDSGSLSDASSVGEWDGTSKFDAEKNKAAFRNYEDACERVKAFYATQHEKQTVAYNKAVRERFEKVHQIMGVWEAMEMLNTLVDDSDPDTNVSQIEHLLQTAEAIRRDGKPDWMQVAGLVHDLGKLLVFFGAEGQWDVVGDTFVVGCKFSDKIIYPETFVNNPDSRDPVYSTECGIYTPHCGLENVMLSWGHDEYLYRVFKNQSSLPVEALYMIRYHSFYPWHREGAYAHLMNAEDERALEAVRAFNPYDLYSKSDEPVDVEKLKPYYQGLIAKFFPKLIRW